MESSNKKINEAKHYDGEYMSFPKAYRKIHSFSEDEIIQMLDKNFHVKATKIIAIALKGMSVADAFRDDLFIKFKDENNRTKIVVGTLKHEVLVPTARSQKPISPKEAYDYLRDFVRNGEKKSGSSIWKMFVFWGEC